MKSSATAIALALAIPLLAGGAQPGTATLEQAAAPEQSPVPAPPGSYGSDQRGLQAPVLRITSVEIMRSAHAPTLDVIRVRGLASSAGWEDAELVPLTRGIPADGMLHLLFIARAPAEAAEASGFEAIEAIFPLEPSHPFKGVNVHSASESISVTSLPGYAEGRAAGEDCAKCVGKTFVARGTHAPSGKSAAELVREEQLPPMTRVIRSSDGIPSADANPNRLTLILSQDGRITSAVWE